MLKRIVSGIILTLLLMGMLTFAFNIQPVGAAWTETIYIRADGSVVPDAAPISTIDNITYTLTDNILGDFSDYTSAIIVERDNVTIDGNGYTLQRLSGRYTNGLSLYGTNMTIKNTRIKSFYNGIYLNSTSHSSSISNNTVADSVNDGIHLSSNNTVQGNNIIDSHSGISAGFGNIVTENVITASDYSGISAGFGNIVTGNVITASDSGIICGSGNIISGNTIKEGYYGLEVDLSSGNTISGNNITANGGSGIYLRLSSDHTISGNNITSNGKGIDISYSSNNTIFGNDIARNGDGIIIRDSSLTNLVYGNNIMHNTRYGNRFSGLTSCPSNNILYHNNFINNTSQVYISVSGENTWDDGYPSGGNYWSDYEERYPSAEELDDSGLWDTAYVIDENNQDNYPLMESWIERTVGAKIGDSVKYSVNTSWTGVLDPRLEMLSETEWGMIEVTDVQSTVVTFTGTSHFKNGSELTSPGVEWDIAPTGSFGFIFWFIGSNLQAGERVYPSGPMIINETVTRTYCGVPRENNHLNVSTSGSIVPGPPYSLNKLDCYWDQATGILTEELLECSTEDLSSTLSIHLKMVDTNVWEAPIPTTIGELKTKIDEFGYEREIDNRGIVKSLLAKLNVAQKLVDKGKIDEARSILEEDFISQVQNQAGIHITPEAADILIKSAEYILANL